MTSTVASASPAAASKAASQPSSTSTWSTSGPRTPATSARRCGPGTVTGLVERERQRLGPGRPRVLVGFGAAADLLGPRRPPLGRRRARRPPAPGPRLRPARRPPAPTTSARRRSASPATAVGLRLDARSDRAVMRSTSAVPRSTPACSALSSPRTSAARPGDWRSSAQARPTCRRSGSARPRPRPRCVAMRSSSGRDPRGLGVDLGQLPGQLGRLGLEAGDEGLVHQAPRARARCPWRRSASSEARPRAFSRSASERTRSSLTSSPPSAVRRDSAPSTSVSSVASRARSVRSCSPRSRRVVAWLSSARLQAAELEAGHVDPQVGQLLDQRAVAAGGVGLALERSELAAHLAEQVLEAGEVALGGRQPALGLLLAAAVLQDAGRLLDDQPPVLGPGVEHGVDLALRDDHVLLPADAGVGQELLDVEEPARARR